MSIGKVAHGRASVSWGPRFYGPDMVIANCPVDAFPDLVIAVGLAAERITDAPAITSVDVVQVLRERLNEDEKFIADHHGYCREYPQNARVEFVEELIDKHQHWASKAESWDYREDYCNERANFLNDLLLLIARNWETYE